MNSYGPRDGLHVTILGKATAVMHTRRVIGIADKPEVGLGWTPYTVLVTSYGATAHTAFHSVAQLKRWLGDRYRVELRHAVPGYGYSMWTGKVVSR